MIFHDVLSSHKKYEDFINTTPSATTTTTTLASPAMYHHDAHSITTREQSPLTTTNGAAAITTVDNNRVASISANTNTASPFLWLPLEEKKKNSDNDQNDGKPAEMPTNTSLHNNYTCASFAGSKAPNNMLCMPNITDNYSMVNKHVVVSWRNLTYDVKVSNPNYISKKETSKKRKDNNESNNNNNNIPIEEKHCTKTLLNNLSGVACGARLLAIMGPSGAGKTTFLKALIGESEVNSTQRLYGNIFLNGIPVTDSLSKIFSVVASDNILLETETPRNAFNFAARMKLRLNATEAALAAEQMIEHMGLEKCADKILNASEEGGGESLSKGQMKRVNIGSEIITNPYVLFLDEPTTGLDSVNAFKIGKLIRDLAHKDQRTVICTIHTPSSQLFGLFDDLILMAKGNIIFHGPLTLLHHYLKSIEKPIPERTNPAEYLLDLSQGSDEELNYLFDSWRSYLSSSSTATRRNKSIITPETNLQNSFVDKDLLKATEALTLRVGLWQQFVVLLARSVRTYYRMKIVLYIRVLMTLLLSIIIGLFYRKISLTSKGMRDVSGLLYVSMNSCLFPAFFPAAQFFINQRPIIFFEQKSSTYNSALIIATKILVEIPGINLTCAIPYSAIIWWVSGLPASASQFFKFCLLIFITMNMGWALGVTVACVLTRMAIIGPFMTLLVFPMNLVSGFVANTERLVPYFVWLNWISIFRYTYMGLVTLVVLPEDNLCPPDQTGTCLYETGQDYLRYVGFEGWRWYYSIFALSICFCILMCIGTIALIAWSYKYKRSYKFSKIKVVEE